MFLMPFICSYLKLIKVVSTIISMGIVIKKSTCCFANTINTTRSKLEGAKPEISRNFF